MEFLRFGSSIPGSYWGCCACDIIQNFKVDPDEKASIQLCSGDGGSPLGFIGKTYKEIFLQRLKFGTFGTNPMPDHAFIAILTHSQVSGGVGQKWLKILKEQGFEFIRRVDNSVYSGQSVAASPAKSTEDNANYIFMLVRNIGTGSFKDQFTPPPAWSSLPKVVEEAHEHLDISGKDLTKKIFATQKELYSALPATNVVSEDYLEKEGIPVTYCGVRSGGSHPNAFVFVDNPAPQELKTVRQKRVEQRKAQKGNAPAVNAFPVKHESLAELAK